MGIEEGKMWIEERKNGHGVQEKNITTPGLDRTAIDAVAKE